MAILKPRVLFVCIHNSARSKMSEAFLRQLGGSTFEADSAGLEPGSVNPVVAEVMKEIGIDINPVTQSVFDLFRQGKRYDAVITVCDGAKAETCPLFPGTVLRLFWLFPDPSTFKGTRDELLSQTRTARDEIKEKIKSFIDEYGNIEQWFSKDLLKA